MGAAAVEEIIELSKAGEKLSCDDVAVLYGIDALSSDAAVVMQAAYELSQQASDGIAQIHAQIGLDASPCARNCAFCSFAARSGLRTGVYELSKGDVVDSAKQSIEDGANLILMLTTANYEFEKLLDMTGEVANALGNEYPVLVGTDDYTFEQAVDLRKAGCSGVYHALRLGEGLYTGISADTRRSTIENAHAAGLKHCTCVEPIGPEHSPRQLAEHTLYARDSNAVFGGAWRRDTVPGEMGRLGMIDEAAWALCVAAYRVAVGVGVPMTTAANSTLLARAGANCAWTETGPSPRDVNPHTEFGIGMTIEQTKRNFAETGWKLLEGPATEWFEDYDGPVDEALITHSTSE